MRINENYKLYYHFFNSTDEERAHKLFSAISFLYDVNDCEEVISNLTKQLEGLFVNVTAKDCEKKLGDLVYYENGLIKNTRQNYHSRFDVIASPWKNPIEEVVEENKEQPEKKKKHKFFYIKNLNRYYRYYDNNRSYYPAAIFPSRSRRRRSVS